MLSHVDGVRIWTPEERLEPDWQGGALPGADVVELPVVQERQRAEVAGPAGIVDEGSFVLTKRPFSGHHDSC